MNITIVQGGLLPIPPVLGGSTEKVWFDLGKQFVVMGHNVTHISRKHENFPNSEIIDGVIHKRIKGYFSQKFTIFIIFFDFFYSLRAIRAIPNKCDIIISNNYWFPIVAFFLKKIIYVHVGRTPGIQFKFYQRANRFIVPSSATELALKKVIKLNYHSKIKIIPYAIPFDVNGKIDIASKDKTILYCGRIHPKKGIENIIKAINYLNIENWNVDIIGPWDIEYGGGGTKYYQHLKNLIQNKNINLLPPIFDQEKLMSCYKKASIFLYPSEDNGETFGVAPLEAMALGCVPIVSDLICFKDFIIQNQNGLIFNHNNKNSYLELAEMITTLINNNELRITLANKAIEVKKKHSLSEISNLLLKDFRLILNQSKQA